MYFQDIYSPQYPEKKRYLQVKRSWVSWWNPRPCPTRCLAWCRVCRANRMCSMLPCLQVRLAFDKLHCCGIEITFLGFAYQVDVGQGCWYPETFADNFRYDIRHLHIVWQLLKWYHIHEWRIPVHLVTTGDKHRGRWANFMGATVKMIRLDYLQSSPWILTIEFGMRQSQLFVDLTYPLCITVPFFTVVWFSLLQDLQQ